MQTNKYLTTTNRVNTNQGFVLLLILGLGSTLLGCSDNLVTAGKDGIRIRGGEWTGKNLGCSCVTVMLNLTRVVRRN
jgi:hypothetical protein